MFTDVQSANVVMTEYLKDGNWQERVNGVRKDASFGKFPLLKTQNGRLH